MKLIKCKKCGRYFQTDDDLYELAKCTGCGSTDLSEYIYNTSPESSLNWEQVRADAAIAAMPIAHQIVDNLHGSKYHSANRMHTIEFFVEECVGIADALVAELKKKH